MAKTRKSSSKTVAELRKLCKEKGISGYSGLNKSQLAAKCDKPKRKVVRKRSRKTSKKGSRKTSRKASKKGSRKASQKGSTKTVTELRKLCKEKGISGYSGLSKAELVAKCDKPKKKIVKKKVVRRKIVKKTKYKTGTDENYEGSCNQKKVDDCVKQDKYCNVDSNRCVAVSGVKTKLKKDDTLAVDTKHGIVGKAGSVNETQKYLKPITKAKQKKLDVGIKTKIIAESPEEKPKKVAKKKKSVPTKNYSSMLVADLKVELKKRGLPLSGTKKVLISRLQKDDAGKTVATKTVVSGYSSMTVAELKKELKKRKLPISGIKSVLIKRLEKSDKAVKPVAAPKKKKVVKKVKKVKVVPKKKKEPVKALTTEGYLSLLDWELDYDGNKPMLVGSVDIPTFKKYFGTLPSDGVTIENVPTTVFFTFDIHKNGLHISAEYDTEVGTDILPQNIISNTHAARKIATFLKSKEKLELDSEDIVDFAPEDITEESEEPEVSEDITEESEELEPEESEEPEDYSEVTEESEELTEKSCADTGCDVGEACDLGSGKCAVPGDIKAKDVKNQHMLVYDGGVYYGSKAALANFALEMDIEDPEIETASKKSIKKQLEKGQKKKKKPVKIIEEEPVEEEAVSSLEEDIDLDIAGIIGEPDEEEVSEVEDVDIITNLADQVSSEKPLTQEEKEMVEKLRKCIGI